MQGYEITILRLWVHRAPQTTKLVDIIHENLYEGYPPQGPIF
jgi:hypothetical protein